MVTVKIITGGTNSGKTTLLKKIEREYRKKAKITAGFFAEAELSGGQKSRYYFMDIKSGKRMLSVFENADHPDARGASIEKFGFSRFYFSQEAFSFAENLLEAVVCGVENRTEVPDAVFVDELGPLELSERGLYRGVKGLLSRYDGTVFLVIRENLLANICSIMEIDLENAGIIRPGRGGHHA